MPKRFSKPKRPTDVNLLAHQLVRESTEDRAMKSEPPKMTRDQVSQFMSAMGRKGGKKSAKARMVKISPEDRKAIALKAARARWQKDNRSNNGT